MTTLKQPKSGSSRTASRMWFQKGKLDLSQMWKQNVVFIHVRTTDHTHIERTMEERTHSVVGNFIVTKHFYCGHSFPHKRRNL